jgi:flagellar motor switch protein FliN/FliY
MNTMAAFTEENVEAILAACSGNAVAIAESFNQCFGKSYRLEPGDSNLWSAAEIPASLNGPGVMALLQAQSQGLAVLLPESLNLPEWISHPNDSENARLQTLSMEWSLSLLPPEMEAEKYRTLVVAELAQALQSLSPAEWAATLEFKVFDAEQTSAEPISSLLVVWPLERPDFEDQAATVAEPIAETPTQSPPTTPLPPADPLARLRQLPIQVSVRLAEKKIPMLQLLSITPGMLITFSKSCEDLLDLYVNNARYCRGEAVKIGENFGLKINQVGVPPESTHKVIDA